MFLTVGQLSLGKYPVKIVMTNGNNVFTSMDVNSLVILDRNRKGNVAIDYEGRSGSSGWNVNIVSLTAEFGFVPSKDQ
jgi:hypothetical protein